MRRTPFCFDQAIAEQTSAIATVNSFGPEPLFLHVTATQYMGLTCVFSETVRASLRASESRHPDLFVEGPAPVQRVSNLITGRLQGTEMMSI